MSSSKKLDIYFGITTYQTLGDCVKELIVASYSIYLNLLSKVNNHPITIVCGGQSPSYYCLAMMNFKIFNPKLVNIIILPHSKGGVKSDDQNNENILYCERLKEKGIILNDNVVIIDGVHSGTGILALESALKYCFPSINVYKIAINSQEDIAKITVDEEIVLPSEPKFSDTFPRLVTSFHPRDFNDSSKFITEFINLENNPVAKMIIDIAKKYPKIPVEETDWYIDNNEVTDEIKREREKERIRIEKISELKHISKLKRISEDQLKKKGGTFKTIILNDPKRYQCPKCKTITGELAPLYPKDTTLFSHNFDCQNRFKIPIEY